jgi:glucose/mannose-6-phosphate isomerase
MMKVNDISLDDIKHIIEFDTDHVLTSLQSFKRQCEDVQKYIVDTKYPVFPEFSHCIIAGMGGSHLGARILVSLYQQLFTVPVTILSDYTVPGYIGKNTLIIATSYSGNTEETQEFLYYAQKKHAQIVCISSGGSIGKFANQYNLPACIFTPLYNPSKIARYGFGYLFMAQLFLFMKTGVIQGLTNSDIQRMYSYIEISQKRYDIDQKETNNQAKCIARKTYDFHIAIAASDHLIGAAYLCKNQINETAKMYANSFEIPDMNHHLLEGLTYPVSNKNTMAFLLYESDLYHHRNKIRYPIIKNILTKQHINSFSFQPIGKTKQEQTIDAILFSTFYTFYVSFLYHIKPAPNPWVDILKKELLKNYVSVSCL